MSPLSPSAPTRFHRFATWFLAALIACRIVAMIFVPHSDNSESRYAEISRKMVETGDWITPQFDYGVPFWAKPPLSMWMSATGIELFGANEFGSRIFIFLAAMGILALVADAVRREADATSGRVAAALLMGMPVFFYCSAAVMTDLALLLGTTLAMLSFRTAVRENSRRWGYGFFVGLAIGLLAKGPLALVIAIPPVAGWIALTGSWRRSWKSVPWFSGTLLMLALALPWYLAAENKTPGFLDYFIVGEHWKRFTVRGWTGDLYGNAHSETPGMIWVYLILVTFPWCLGFFAIPFRKWREGRTWALAGDGSGLYWILWAVWPVAFFTPARNIISSYPLPALPAMAILLAGLVRARSDERITWKRFHPFHPALAGVCLLMVFVAGTVAIFAPELAPKLSERELVSIFRAESGSEDRLLYFGSRRYSAEFYSGGQVETTKSMTELVDRLESPGRLFLATTSNSFAAFPPDIQRRFIQRTPWKNKRKNLYIERDDIPLMTGIDAARIHPIGN